MIEVRGVGKRFPGVRALHDVHLRLAGGEVVAVIGENGAGKSTLMRILAGIERPDAGSILVDGVDTVIAGVRHARQLGIAIIHQELNLCDNLSVGANVFLGIEPIARWRIDEPRIRAGAQAILRRIGLDVDPDVLVGALPVGRQQLVEIARALATNARVLIMDEPTSSLSQQEAERLFRVIDGLRDQGVSVIYISHRLSEVAAVADRVVVLRDGRNAGALTRAEISHEAMVRLMVGRDLQQLYRHVPHGRAAPLLRLDRVRSAAHPDRHLSLEVCAGEIVGLAGLVGAGRSELLRTLFGIDPWLGGELQVCGAMLRRHAPADAIAAGMVFVPEDRKSSGLVIEQSVADNLRLARLHRDRGRLGFIRRTDFADEARALVARLGIRTPSLAQEVRLLSGGNQQKVVLGKWLTLRPRVVLLDEPTRGIDVGAKAEIYQLMDELARDGAAVLFASSELEEVLGMSDRVLVMHDGAITGELARDELSEQAVMDLATGRVGAA